jgi:hypothetical protein
MPSAETESHRPTYVARHTKENDEDPAPEAPRRRRDVGRLEGRRPDGNVSAWLRSLANAALSGEQKVAGEHLPEPEVPAVVAGNSSREEYLRRKAKLLAAINPKE